MAQKLHKQNINQAIALLFMTPLNELIIAGTRLYLFSSRPNAMPIGKTCDMLIMLYGFLKTPLTMPG